MRLMIVIVSDRDADPLAEALLEAGHRATVLASTGIFLRRGNSTLLIGLEPDQVDQALEIIKVKTTPSEDPAQRRATVFVLNVARFEQV